MPAQWAAGGRPLLGPDDSAIAGNRFDWGPDCQSWMSAALAATDYNAGNTAFQRRTPGQHAAKPVASADVAYASRTGNGYAHARHAGAGRKRDSQRLWSTGHDLAAIALFHAGAGASLGLFQLGFVTIGPRRFVGGNSARPGAGGHISRVTFAARFANAAQQHGSCDWRARAAGASPRPIPTAGPRNDAGRA